MIHQGYEENETARMSKERGKRNSTGPAEKKNGFYQGTQSYQKNRKRGPKGEELSMRCGKKQQLQEPEARKSGQVVQTGEHIKETWGKVASDLQTHRRRQGKDKSRVGQREEGVERRTSGTGGSKWWKRSIIKGRHKAAPSRGNKAG